MAKMNGNNTKLYSANLRIASKTKSTSDISSMLGVEPSESYNIGEVLSLRGPHPRHREESLWLLNSNVSEEQPLEKHLNDLLSFVENKTPELGLLALECDIEIFCSYATYNGQGGFVLDRKLIEKMAKVNVDFVFDLYLVDQDSDSS